MAPLHGGLFAAPHHSQSWGMRSVISSVPHLSYHDVTKMASQGGTMRLATAIHGSHFPLHLPLIVPLFGADDDGVHLRVRRLQTDVVLLFVDALEGSCAAFGIACLVGGNDDVAVVDVSSRINQHVVAVSDMIFDHGLPTHQQHILTSVLTEVKCLLLGGRVNIKRNTSGNRASDAQPLHFFAAHQPDATALPALAMDIALLVQDRQVIIYMAGRFDMHCLANFTIGWWHAISPRIFANEVINLCLCLAQVVVIHDTPPLTCFYSIVGVELTFYSVTAIPSFCQAPAITCGHCLCVLSLHPAILSCYPDTLPFSRYCCPSM